MKAIHENRAKHIQTLYYSDSILYHTFKSHIDNAIKFMHSTAEGGAIVVEDEDCIFDIIDNKLSYAEMENNKMGRYFSELKYDFPVKVLYHSDREKIEKNTAVILVEGAGYMIDDFCEKDSVDLMEHYLFD